MRKKFVLTFVGDTSLGDWYLRQQGNSIITNRLDYDPFSFFQGVKPLVEDSDHFIINLETVLEENPSEFLEDKQYPNWDQPKRMLDILHKLGVTAVGLSNNHSMDFGPRVMLSTIGKLDASGIKVFGAGENEIEAGLPLKFTLEGENDSRNVYIFSGMNATKRYKEEYHFFATVESPGIKELTQETQVKNISEIRNADPEALIVVFPHWQGQDYKWTSQNSWIREICHSFIDAGADYVLGQGPHMLNDIEKYRDGIIAYSIGNFIFNSPGRYQKFGVPPYSFVVRLEVSENKDSWTVEPYLYPIVTDNKSTNYRVTPIKGEKAMELLQILRDRAFVNEQNVLYGLGENEKGFFLTVDNNSAQDKPENKQGIIQESNNILDIITGKIAISEIDFNDPEVIKMQVKDLKIAHQKIDKVFKEYYDRLSRSRVIRRNEFSTIHQLCETAKKEYVTHGLLRKFEREKIRIPKALSFREIMVENSELRRIGCHELAWKLDKKNSAYQFADKIGLRRPIMDNRIYGFEEIQKPNGPAVIKPISSTGSMGVYLMFNENSILSAREGIYLNNWEELQKDARKKLEDGKSGKNPLLRKDRWMIEELVLSAVGSTVPPNDLKFYCFYGEVLLILEANRAQNDKFCFWDSGMNLIKTGKYEGKGQFFEDGTGFTQEDLNVVISASLQIPVPFIRLDMLKGHDGLVFGEATPRPGKFHLFNDQYDRKLGEAYRRAEARILHDLLNGKNHFLEPFTHNP